MSFTREITIPELELLKDADKVPSALRALKANCVKTARPWDERYGTGEFGLKGPRRISVED